MKKNRTRWLIAAGVLVAGILTAALVVNSRYSFIPRHPKYGNRIGGPAPTAPAAADYSFALMGDSRNNARIIDKCLRGARGAGVPFGIFSGDLVNTGNNAFFEDFYRTVCSATEGRLPIYLVIGNHDLLQFGRLQLPVTYRNYFGPDHYTFWYGQDAFVVFNDVPDRFTEPQAAALEQSLEEIRGSARNIFLVCHEPPVDPKPDPSVPFARCLPQDARERLIALAKKYRAAAILTGHIHAYSDSVQDGVRLIISGGAGQRLDKGAQYHWTLVTVNGTNVSAKQMVVESADAPASD